MFLRIGVGKGNARTEQLVCLEPEPAGEGNADSVTP